jgi:hypothetical protein
MLVIGDFKWSYTGHESQCDMINDSCVLLANAGVETSIREIFCHFAREMPLQ